MSGSKRITIRLSEEQYNKVMNESESKGMTISDYIRSRIGSSDMVEKRTVVSGLAVLCNSINRMEEDVSGCYYRENLFVLKGNVKNLWSILQK